MKSIRKRILTLSLICVVLSNIIIMAIGMADMTWTVNSDSEKLIQQIAQEKVQEIDTQLLAVEQAVVTMHDYILELIEEDPDFWKDDGITDSHLQRVYELANIVVRNTAGAKSVYYHLSPEIGRPASGVYISETVLKDYQLNPATDLSAYGKDDVQMTGWYYAPIEKGKAVWMQPYQNARVNRRVISYVCPVMYGEQEIGVVGMDIDLSMFQELVRSVKVYNTGYAFLLEPDGDIVYHREYPYGISQENFTEEYREVNSKIIRAQSTGKISTYKWRGKERKILFCKLRNDMSLGISMPTSEVRRPARVFMVLSIIAFIAEVGLAFVLSARVSSVIVRPLQELTEVAQKLERGELDVNIRCQTGDEVEALAKSLQQTANELRKYMDDVNTFARTDALTGAWNKSAYEEQINKLEEEIAEGTAEFSVAVLDVNNLKHMNDTYGHEAGDLWITSAATAMMRAFGKSRIYRIGGDEFAVILEPNARKRYDQMVAEFNREMDRFNNRENKEFVEELHIALGLADYDSATDPGYAEVFRRADTQMYVNKKYLKGLLI